jgi:hypothetical protein
VSYHIPGSMCVGVTVWFGWGCGILMQVEALLICSCGMWGLGVNGRLEYWVCFSWALLRNEFAFVVEGLDIVLFVRQE